MLFIALINDCVTKHPMYRKNEPSPCEPSPCKPKGKALVRNLCIRSPGNECFGCNHTRHRPETEDVVKEWSCCSDNSYLPRGHVAAGNLRDASSFGRVFLWLGIFLICSKRLQLFFWCQVSVWSGFLVREKIKMFWTNPVLSIFVLSHSFLQCHTVSSCSIPQVSCILQCVAGTCTPDQNHEKSSAKIGLSMICEFPRVSFRFVGWARRASTPFGVASAWLLFFSHSRVLQSSVRKSLGLILLLAFFELFCTLIVSAFAQCACLFVTGNQSDIVSKSAIKNKNVCLFAGTATKF